MPVGASLTNTSAVFLSRLFYFILKTRYLFSHIALIVYEEGPPCSTGNGLEER